MSVGVLAALLTGLGLGALVAAQVWPVPLLCVRTTLRHGFAPGLAVGAGAAAVDTVHGALGLLGAASLPALAGRRLGDRALQVADVVAGAGLVGFGALLGIRTARDG